MLNVYVVENLLTPYGVWIWYSHEMQLLKLTMNKIIVNT